MLVLLVLLVLPVLLVLLVISKRCCTQLERLGPIARTPGIPGSDKNDVKSDKITKYERKIIIYFFILHDHPDQLSHPYTPPRHPPGGWVGGRGNIYVFSGVLSENTSMEELTNFAVPRSLLLEDGSPS